MIRTRDLVLFVLVRIFLSMAISITVLVDGRSEQNHSLWLGIANITPANFEVEVPEVALMDRQSNLERLREKLSHDESRITPDPDTFIGSEEVIKDEAKSPAVATETMPVSKCLYPDDVVSKLAAWPLRGVTVSVQGGTRLVSVSEVVAIPTLPSEIATTTQQTETIVTTLLQLPLSPQKNIVASCLPSEIIGVTSGGFLLFNNDGMVWRNTNADTFIGYARDGFPIYGVYTGVTDECGGYDHPTGYRYSISLEHQYMLGCFSATPQSFNF